MAVGYYSGTSTGPNDLIDKLRLALIAESWTVDAFTAVGAGYRLHVHKTLGGEVCYFNFRSAISETGTTLITEDNGAGAGGTVTGLIINGSTGYDAGQVWHKQTGYPQHPYRYNYSYGCCMSPISISSIPAYYFFFVGNSVHIVVEITAGKFQFMSFGMLVKQGTFTGGQYFTASCGTHYPAYDYDGSQNYFDIPRYFTYCYDNSGVYAAAGAIYLNDVTTDWKIAVRYSSNYPIIFPCPTAQSYGGGHYTSDGLNGMFYKMSPSSYNGMSAMAPIYILRKRADNNMSLLGWPEGVRFLNVTNYSAAEEIAYGAETWMVFDANGVSFTRIYPYCGFAFLKDDGT